MDMIEGLSLLQSMPPTTRRGGGWRMPYAGLPDLVYSVQYGCIYGCIHHLDFICGYELWMWMWILCSTLQIQA